MIYRLIRITVHLMSYIPYSLGQFLGKMLGTAVSMIPLHRYGSFNKNNRQLRGYPGNLDQTVYFLKRLIHRYNVAYENIRKCFGDRMDDPGIKKIYRGVLVHYGRMIFELPHIFKLNSGNLDRYVEFINEKHLTEALKKGKGALLLSGHFGNWEMISAALAIRFKQTIALARPVDFKPMDQFFNELRSQYGLQIIPKQRSMRKILEALRENKTIGILLDQNVDWYEGVFVKFFGDWACTDKGLATIARKIGTPVIPFFLVRQQDGRHCLIFEQEVKFIRTNDKIRDIEENTALFTEVIERYIRKYPDHWFWFHMRWKTRPYCSIDK